MGKRTHKTVLNDEIEAAATRGEANVGGSIGSNEELDYLDEDLMRNPQSRAIGYFGKNSDVQWLSSVQRQTERTRPELLDQPYGPPGSSNENIRARSDALHKRRKNNAGFPVQGSIMDSTFYLDSDDMKLDIVVDPYEEPEPEMARRLFECYLETVHSSYPLVSDHLSIRNHTTY